MLIISKKLNLITLSEWRERVLILVHKSRFKDFYKFLENILESFAMDNQQFNK